LALFKRITIPLVRDSPYTSDSESFIPLNYRLRPKAARRCFFWLFWWGLPTYSSSCLLPLHVLFPFTCLPRHPLTAFSSDRYLVGHSLLGCPLRHRSEFPTCSYCTPSSFFFLELCFSVAAFVVSSAREVVSTNYFSSLSWRRCVSGEGTPPRPLSWFRPLLLTPPPTKLRVS